MQHRFPWRLLLASLAIPALFAGCQSSEQPIGHLTIPPRKIVTFSPVRSTRASRAAVLVHAGITVVDDLPLINAVVIEANAGVTAQLAQQPDILRIEDDALVSIEPPFAPTRAESLPWGVKAIHANAVWDTDGNLTLDANAQTNAGNNIKIAVLDTGIDATHSDLRAN